LPMSASREAVKSATRRETFLFVVVLRFFYAANFWNEETYYFY